jgi:hypothetical protein
MPIAFAASIIDFMLGLQLGSTAQDSSNRFSVEGLTIGAQNDGALVIAIERLEAASLQLASGPVTLKVGRLTLNKLAGQVRFEGGRPRLITLEAANADLSGVKVQGALIPSHPSQGDLGPAAASSWSLGPLAAADGNISAKIPDAHLLFDADVTVPIRQGQIDFNDATVEHVGPDSRMGVAPQGLYVDAPNGRSYLYQFSSTPVAGVEHEQRNALLGPFVSDRGKLKLQVFVEGLLSHAQGGPGVGFTEQTRLLFDRTALSGEMHLGDGRFAAPGVQADVVGQADGRNVVRLQSEAVGRGLTAEMASLSIRHAVLNSRDLQLGCAEITGSLTVRVFLEGAQWRFAFSLDAAKISGLRFVPRDPTTGSTTGATTG